MVKGTSSMALGGRHLVKAAVGEDVTEEEMGGSAVHTKISGVADLEVADDAECLRDRARVPVVLPAAQRRAAADAADRPIPSTGASRSCTTSCRPRHGARTTCARSCTAIVDDGDVFWMKPEWAKNLVTGLARDRRPAGRHRREPADGARRRARRERGRQGGALRVAVRRVQHPARVPARRARLHRRLARSRSRASSATAPRCCSR